MRRSRTPGLLAAILIAFVVSLPVSLRAHAPVAVPEMTTAARVLIDALPDPLRAKLIYPLESPERENWGFVPRSRNGLLLRELPESAKPALDALLRTGLSTRGHALAESIIALENVLRALEGAARRDPGLYAVTVFGNPAPTGAWGWRFEGHHLSLNFVIIDGHYAGSTPSFFGANPSGHKPGRGTGHQPFAEEERLARELLATLTPAQQRQAIVSGEAPYDILTGDSRRARIFESDQGIAVADLTEPQRDLLLALLRTQVFRHREDVAGAELQAIMDAGWERVRFVWAGPTEPKQPHYYRIQGPTFVVEYDNVQNEADHVHSVWREYDGDFGRDLLAEHRARAHGERAKPE